MIVAGPEAGRPSTRTLLLLYAADLAFRLRWQIRPALLDGRVLVVAPYVDTAIALGRAADIDAKWLRDLLSFAPRPSERHYVEPPDAVIDPVGHGLVEYACRHIDSALAPAEIVTRTCSFLEAGRRGAARTAGRSRRPSRPSRVVKASSAQ
jgi:hypothetical protein